VPRLPMTMPVKTAVTIIVIVACLIGLFAWMNARKAERENREALVQAEGIAKVVSATFSKQSQLEVGQLAGSLTVKSVDPGAISVLRSSQTARLPFTVDYVVDLSQMALDDYRWDAKTRTLLVEAPEVRPARPNIDESKRAIQSTSGIFVTRGASENLSRRGSALAKQRVATEAEKPEHVQAARENARTVIATMLETPMELAGLGDVTVKVHFPAEGYRNSERWDVSPSIAEVLAQHRR